MESMMKSICNCRVSCSSVLLFLIINASLPDSSTSCTSGKLREKKTVYGTVDTYTVPDKESEYRWATYSRYEDISHCEVLFRSFFSSDHVKITFTEVNLDGPQIPMDYSSCRDKIVLYDGNSTNSPVLKTICGGLTPTVQSTDNFILLVFTRDIVNSPKSGGFSLTYKRIDRVYSSSSGGGFNIAWTAIAVPVIAVFSCFVRCAYMKCKSMAYDYEQQQIEEIHRNANADLARNRPLSSTTASHNGHEAQIQLNTSSAEGGGGGDAHQARYTVVDASAPSYEDVVGPGQFNAGSSSLPPPPSYEEAASGKYDPKPA